MWEWSVRKQEVWDIYITLLLGYYFKHRVAFVHTITTPPPAALHRLFSQSVNGHLCVNNSTLILFYHECLFEFQQCKRWCLPVLLPCNSNIAKLSHWRVKGFGSVVYFVIQLSVGCVKGTDISSAVN